MTAYGVMMPPSYHIQFALHLGLSRFLASRAEENPIQEVNFRDRGNHLSFLTSWPGGAGSPPAKNKQP